MRHVAEVLSHGGFAGNHAAKFADLSSKSCIPVQQSFLVCRIKTRRAGRSFEVSFAYLGAIGNVLAMLSFDEATRQNCTANYSV
jgi:hypothetical protein